MATKQSNPFPQFEELNQSLQDYSLRFTRALSGNIAPAIREQANLAASTLESAAAHAEKMAKMKDPQEVFAAQSQLMNDMSASFMSTAKTLMELQTDMNDEMRKLVEEGMRNFSPDHLKKFMPQK